MSKSTGNVINPQDVVEKYGSDALRYWASSSKLGEDVEYQEKDVVTGKKFVTKILNASNFIFMNLKKYKPKKTELIETDRIFLVMLNETISKCTKAFENYEYSRAKSEADSFFWKMFCDNYLEIVKYRVYNGNKKEKESASYTLYNSLFAILKLMAPFTPFVTEDIYQEYFKANEKTKSIHLCNWPEEFKIKEKKDDEEKFNLFLNVISDTRKEKAKEGKSVKAEIILSIDKKTIDMLSDFSEDLKSVLNAKKIREGKFKVEFI